MPFNMFATWSMAAFAADCQFVERVALIAVGKVCRWNRATSMAADAVIGHAAAEASGIIGLVTGSNIPAGLL